jgi:DNA polymerase-3 subunit epsilon
VNDASTTTRAPTTDRFHWKLAVAVAIVFVVVMAIGAAAALALWSRIPADLQTALSPILDDSEGLVLVFGAFLLIALGLLVGTAFRMYVGGMVRLTDGARVIVNANPAHRLPEEGPTEAIALARLVNELADRQQSAQDDVELRVREASAGLEEEKHRLAALMSEFTASVLVCNREGLILLYNDAAHAMFARDGARDGAESGIVGLGRSVFGIIDRDLLAHALDLLRERLRQGEARPVSQFVAGTTDGRLIRAQMAPVRGAGDRAASEGITGFVLTLDDVTGVVQRGEEHGRLLQTLNEETRAGLASIRAAVETIIHYESMEPALREQFTAIIRDEAVRLSKRLDQTLEGDAAPAPWPLQAMKASDLLLTVQRSVARLPHSSVTANPGGVTQWLSVDSFAVVQSFTALAARLESQFGVRDFALRLSPGGRFTGLELTFRPQRPDAGDFTMLEQEASNAPDGGGRLSLREVAARHGGEHWWRADRQAGTVTYCMQLPVATDAPAAAPSTGVAARPIFYDFELFERAGESSAFDQSPLDELVYTVFDTETTGLEPSAGDEIVSISAVRIVNGRLLRHETFDQLVDPRRPLSKESIRIHGITPTMLEGQPTIGDVLRRFARFADDTVLVGHNVAFDMRFLQLKERETGLRFNQPVLDTLLLSAVVQPNVPDHELEANARRLGIPIIGRHTSLGDAIVTGEIFIKLLPLLAAQRIVTLKDALAASQRTFLAGLKY